MEKLLAWKIQNIHLFGYEKYNGTLCAIGQFKIENSKLSVKIWLDSKKGTCLKLINSGLNSAGEQYEIIDEYTATYDVVTNEDVRKPDLTGYTILEDNSNIDND